MVNDMGKYTDEQNFLIMKKQYPKDDIDYGIGDEIVVDNITVGYVSEVIHKPSGEDTYILTDKKLPENPTPKQLAEVKEVTMLYQGSTTDDLLRDIPTDWIITDLAIAAHVYTGTPIYDGNSYEYQNTPSMWNTKINKPIKQLDDMSDTLNSSMIKYPNAGFRLYGHSLSCTGVQVAACRCKYPERIIEVNAYNGPNAQPLFSDSEKEQAKLLQPKIHIFIDTNDIIGLGYIKWDIIGQVHLMDNSRIDVVGQHMGKAYVFDHFGSTLYPNGQLASSYNDFSYIDINKDGIPDLTISKDGSLKNIPITLGNGRTFILQSFDLSSKYFSSFHRSLGQNKIDIQLNPEVLCTLVSNTISDIEISLAIMSGICNLCIANNSNIGDEFDERKTTVYESIAEVFRNCNITLILENLHASVGVFTKNSKVFENLSIQKTLILDSFNDDNVPYTGNKHCPHYLPSSYNNYLLQLANEAANMLEICRTQKCDDNSIISQSQLAIIKSWKNVEDIYEELLQESEKTFEGKGIRVGRKDAIQQSVTDVLDIEASNIKELQNILINLKSFMTVTTTSFDDKDAYLGSAIETGIDFSTNALVPGVPQNYEAYLNRSEIFDDVKDVLQAFDMQVEENSKDYAKKVKQVYDENLGNFEHTLSIWLEQANNFKEKVNTIRNSFNENVSVRKKHYYHYLSKTGNYIETYSYVHSIWGKLRDLYSSTLVDNIETAAEKILPVIPIIEATINSSKTAKDKLGNIEPELKKIIEDGVYKAFDLMEVVQSQKIVLQLAVKCKLQIRFVIDSINNASMKGRAITTILTKLLQIERLLEYFSTFVSDCFGDNYNEEASSTAPQSSAANFSLNSFT
jgi:hypothetical protein